MSESENVLPLDESLWEHVESMDYAIAIPISNRKQINILEALQDIYESTKIDINDTRKMILALAAIFIATPSGKAEKLWEELAVEASMKDFDKRAKEMLDES